MEHWPVWCILFGIWCPPDPTTTTPAYTTVSNLTDHTTIISTEAWNKTTTVASTYFPNGTSSVEPIYTTTIGTIETSNATESNETTETTTVITPETTIIVTSNETSDSTPQIITNATTEISTITVFTENTTFTDTTTASNETTPASNQTTSIGPTETTNTGPSETTGGATTAPTKSSGLSKGAVAGIVISVLVLVAAVAAGSIHLLKRRNVNSGARQRLTA